MSLDKPKSEHLTPTRPLLHHGARGGAKTTRGCVVWCTGLSGSGKSTIARALEQRLVEAGLAAYVLDGDNLRGGLCSDLGFSPQDRTENIRRAGELALLLADAGLVAIAALISPYRRGRDAIRQRLAEGRFVEVFCNANLETCMQRDPKGLYHKAKAGEIQQMTGLDAPYEPPEAPEVSLPTASAEVAGCVDAVWEYLQTHGLLATD